MSAAKLSRIVLAVGFFTSSALLVLSQGSYRAQVRGTIADSTGAVIRDARLLTSVRTFQSLAGPMRKENTISPGCGPQSTR
jgi:hypothetical protein